jgi:demethylmacrocin O-methyltransferase
MNPQAWLKANLPPTARRHVDRLAKALLSWWYGNDLSRLALLFQTDKWGSHWYTQHYQRYLQAIRHKPLNVLEVGVGGFKHREWGGQSLRLWKAYFRKGRIVGIDIYDKTHFREKRIDIRQCDQTDADALRRLSEEYGGFDIVVDDGSHVNEHVVKSFQVLFPLLRPGGIYSIENLQTAYWPSWGGGIDNPRSSMSFFKTLIDGLNHADYPVEHYEPNHFDKNIVEIAFFHGLLLIRKGSNDEKTSLPILIRRELRRVRNAGKAREALDSQTGGSH